MKMTNSSEDPGVSERILASAREELAERGFEATSVRTIADGPGVTPAMINYYFRSKQALYEKVVAEAQRRLQGRLIEALADGPSASRLALAYFDFLSEERHMQRLLLREVLDGGTERFPAFIDPLRAMLSAHFEGEAALQSAISVFGAIAGYFIYEPVLSDLLGEDPLSPDALARRRRHVIELVKSIEESSP